MLSNLLLTDSQVGIFGFFLGIAVVFFGITVLIVVVWAMGKIFSATSKQKVDADPKPKPAPVPVVEPVEEGVPDYVKVAIVAAIMAFYEQQNEKCEFTVKKIVRRR